MAVCDRIRKKSAECSVGLHVWPKFAGLSGVPLVSLRLLDPRLGSRVPDSSGSSARIVALHIEQERKRRPN